MNYIHEVTCSKCRCSKEESSCKRCEKGHLLCRSCLQSDYYLLTTTLEKCPLCNTNLYLPTDSRFSEPFSRPFLDEVKKEVSKQKGKLTFWDLVYLFHNPILLAWKLTFWWWGFLFRNPEILFGLVFWPITLVFLLAVTRNPSFGATVIMWIEGSLIAPIAPILTLVFIQRKRLGLGAIKGWITVWRRDLRLIGVTSGIVSVLFTIHLLIK